MSLSRSVLAVLPGKSADERILALRVESVPCPTAQALQSAEDSAEGGEILSFDAFRRSRPSAPPVASFELCFQSWAERIGWFTQQRVPITGEQAESLRQVFGAFAGKSAVPQGRAVIEAFGDTHDRDAVHVGSA